MLTSGATRPRLDELSPPRPFMKLLSENSLQQKAHYPCSCSRKKRGQPFPLSSQLTPHNHLGASHVCPLLPVCPHHLPRASACPYLTWSSGRVAHMQANEPLHCGRDPCSRSHHLRHFHSVSAAVMSTGHRLVGKVQMILAFLVQGSCTEGSFFVLSCWSMTAIKKQT